MPNRKCALKRPSKLNPLSFWTAYTPRYAFQRDFILAAQVSVWCLRYCPRRRTLQARHIVGITDRIVAEQGNSMETTATSSTEHRPVHPHEYRCDKGSRPEHDLLSRSSRISQTQSLVHQNPQEIPLTWRMFFTSYTDPPEVQNI